MAAPSTYDPEGESSTKPDPESRRKFFHKRALSMDASMMTKLEPTGTVSTNPAFFDTNSSLRHSGKYSAASSLRPAGHADPALRPVVSDAANHEHGPNPNATTLLTRSTNYSEQEPPHLHYMLNDAQHRLYNPQLDSNASVVSNTSLAFVK